MKIDQINNIINDYDKLVDLTVLKIKVIEKLDNHYYTGRRIEDVSFYSDSVSVRCDDSAMGCYDSLSFSFPIIWLTKTDSELEELVTTEKELRIKAKEELHLKQKEEQEQRELERYLKLKEKYEQKTN